MSAADAPVPGARHTVVPRGITSTAWPRIAGTCRNIGWGFDPWQTATGRLILAKKASGAWAADLSILSIPRQVGKSYLLGCIIFALCLLQPRLRVIWTSHHTATTEEMYEAMKELASHKRVAPHIVKCIALQGSRWRIQFRNGSRIEFGARSQGFGRGKSRVGVLVLDEFQHITARALTNLTPTTNTAENPLILCAGTPPSPESPGEAFGLRRKAAIEGLSDDSLYIEFSADADADSDDRRQWAKANPSFPKRTGERAFLLQRKMLPDADFRRDMLGIWDATIGDPILAAILAKWDGLKAAGSTVPPQLGYSVDVSPDRLHAAIGAAGDLDGRTLMFVVEADAGVGWILPKLVELRDTKGLTRVTIDNASPAKSLIPKIEAAGIEVDPATAGDMATACGQLLDAVRAGEVTHLDDPILNAALVAASTRDIGDGGWGWRRKGSGNITPLVAVTLALKASHELEPEFIAAWR